MPQRGVISEKVRAKPLRKGNRTGERYQRPHEWSEELAHKVKLAAALGNSQEAIAALLDTTVETLVKYYRRELDIGKLEIKSKLGAAIVQTAMGEEWPCVACGATGKQGNTPCEHCHGKGRVWIREPNPTAQVWASKNLMGWTDQQRIEHTGEGGGPIVMEQRSAAPTIRQRLQAIRERQAAQLPKPDDPE